MNKSDARFNDNSRFHPETLAIHGGDKVNSTRGLVPPIFQTSTFALETAAEGAAMASEKMPREFYTRWGNPTIDQAREVLAGLEGAESSLVLASGMAAISSVFVAHLSAGDHVVLPHAVYSGTAQLLAGPLARLGVTSTAVNASSLDEVRGALRDQTRMVFVETPSNPRLDLVDLEGIAKLAREHGALSVVDGTFATPINQRPLDLGMDVVVHSATKYLGGHSDLTAGVIAGRRDFIEKCWSSLKLFGASISPFEAWLLLRGLRTLAVRVERQNQSALRLARFLAELPGVKSVHYPWLETSPDHELARRQMRGGGGMLAFEVEGGRERGRRLVESLGLIQLAVSLGGVETIIQHPASMTHGMLPLEQLEAAGIGPGLLRLSVGLEHPEDLERDLEQALAVG